MTLSMIYATLLGKDLEANWQISLPKKSKEYLTSKEGGDDDP